MATGKWNPQESSSQLATVQDGNVKGWDLRTPNKSVWSISQAHTQIARDVDYNRNRQYFVGTCGDDGACRFWDVRHPDRAVVTQWHHSHWVWSLRYNTCHDQLVVSASSDARVVLASVASVSSEPVEITEDGLLVSYDSHEESVYCVEWSPVDPWCFASLSYDGRLLINRVPKSHKYRILGI
ncbi:hypothetical protein AAG570_005420 [Ranatra chinensis]|uniref:EIPR1-like beta-propeller domain-containing protein n=1 Tax=Ranatra chinensis TaxID=642074 RepID=A0ABD0YL05_9HEMI